MMTPQEQIDAVKGVVANWSRKDADVSGFQAMDQIKALLEPGPPRLLEVDEDFEGPVFVDVWTDGMHEPNKVFAYTIEGDKVVRYAGRLTERMELDPERNPDRITQMKKKLGVEVVGNEKEHKGGSRDGLIPAH